eukprot:m.286037 g.286037  ORF g.286037 m.286037 type:complete len:52 (-) comp158203_c0_seq1:12-167(-)
MLMVFQPASASASLRLIALQSCIFLLCRDGRRSRAAAQLYLLTFLPVPSPV